ncbi:MAG: baseplate J/gp47 family protein [Tepidiformaceae bacterium]
MTEPKPPEHDGAYTSDEEDIDPAGLASVILVDRREDVATICGRIDTAPTFAVVVHAPHGNRSLSTELGMRRLQRHADEAGKVLAVATGSSSLGTRARQLGIPVSRRPENVRWDAGGRRVLGFGRHTVALPALGRYLQVAAIAVFGAALGLLALTVAPSADVIVTPPVQTLSEAVTLTVDPSADEIDLDSMTVPAGTVASTQTVTLALKTTGRASVGTAPSKVQLTLTNSGTSAITIPLGAVLVAEPSKIRFQVDQETELVGGGVATQQATALVPGLAGNVPAATPWGWVDQRYAAVTVANGEQAVFGASEERPAVSEDDILAINDLARDLEDSDTVKRLLIAARPHDAVFLGTATATVESSSLSATAGTPTDFLLMEVRIAVSATAVLSNTLDEVARRVLRQGQGIGEFIPGSVVAVETGSSVIDPETGTIQTRVELRGDFASGITSDALKDAVKGKSVEAARSTLRSRYDIQDADVSVSPGWAPWLPRFAFRIDVQLKSPAEDTSPPADATALNGQPSPTATPSPGN